MKYAFFEDKRNLNFILSYLIGIMLGTVIFNCLNMTEKNNLYIYSEYIYNRVNIKEFVGIEYFKHVFIYRLKEVLLLFFLGLTKYKYSFYNVFLTYYGVKISILMCALCVLKGIKALIWFPVLLFPQIIFQVIIICMILNIGMINYSFNKSLIKQIIKIFIYLFICSFSEAVLNPLFVNTFVKII